MVQGVTEHHANKFLLLIILLSLSKLTSARPSTKTSGHNVSQLKSFTKSVSLLVRQQQQQNLEYAVIVDCGSSGTRATVYTWPRGTPTGELAYRIRPLERNRRIVTNRIRPGLASVRDNPNYASDYMRPIMEFATQNVPANQQSTTPVYFLGTAGMRLLTAQEQKAIEDDLENDLRRDFAFQNIQARVISGLEEGVFQWVSINALAQRLTPRFDLPQGKAINLFIPAREERSRRRRLALLEMGGASAQVAFEVSSSMDDLLVRRLKQSLAAWDVYQTSRMDLNLYGDKQNDVSVFSVSFLGFGSDKARELAVDLMVRDSLKFPARVVGKSVHQLLRFAITPNSTVVLQDPCLAEGAEELMMKPLELVSSSSKTIGYQLQQHHRAQESLFNVRLLGQGNYAACQHLLNRVAKISKFERTTCNLESPSEDRLVERQVGVCEAPLIGTNFVPWDHFQFLGLGELHYTSQEIFNQTGQFNGPLFVRNAARLCATSWRNLQALLPASNEFERRRNLLACFKATWIITWLSTILRMPLVSKRADVDFSTTNELGGVEVDWKLGAIITQTIQLQND